MFIFFWTDGLDNWRVSDCPSNWDLISLIEEDGVGACDSISYLLGKLSKYICTRDEPRPFVVVISDEMSILHLFSCKMVGGGKTMLGERFVSKEVSGLGPLIWKKCHGASCGTGYAWITNDVAWEYSGVFVDW